MSESFDLKSPAEQLADEMRRRIRSGAWHGPIPGIHRLTRDFGIGRSTVERALARLKDSGDIVSGGQGLAMRAVIRQAKERDAGTVVAHRVSAEQATGELPELIDALIAVLPRPVTCIRFDSRDTDEERLVRLRSCEVKNFVLVGLRAAIADRLAEDGMHVVSLGGAGSPERAPRVAVDFELLVREGLAMAFAAGHRRVSVPIWRKAPDTALKVRSWVSAGYAAAGLPHSPDFDAPVVTDESPAALHECLRELFRITPPTALVILDVPQWIATLSILNVLRKAIGEDISTILLTRAPELALTSPSQAHFRHPVKELADAAGKILREPRPKKQPAPVMIPPVKVPGNSLRPPAKPWN